MFASYLRTALRNMLLYKLYSTINVLGLAIGLCCCFLIALFVLDELSYEAHYANVDRIYRISKDSQASGGNRDQHMAAHAPQVAPLLKQDYAEIEETARIFCCGNLLLAHDERVFLEGDGVQFADNTLFNIFDFAWLQGDAATALVEPFTAVLTASMAQKYFGNDDPMGQSLLLENQIPLRVTGVLADLPHNTHLDFQMLVSMPTANTMIGEEFLNNWGSNNFHTYVLLKEGATITGIQQQSQEFFARHLGANNTSGMDFTAMPLDSIHLQSKREYEMRTPGSLMTVYAFSAIALLILLIACINFMNLATARSTQRAKEVGVRKAIGAERMQLVQQFMSESLLLVLIAVVLALAMAELLLPQFRAFVQQQLVGYLNDPLMAVVLLLLLTLGIGIAAGAYPALYLSAFRPASVLKGDISRGTAAGVFRKVLVVMQFSIAVVLLIATATMLQQMRFANALDLGYSKEGIVVLSGTPSGGLGSQWETLKAELLAHPGITEVTASNIAPGTPNTNTLGVRFEGSSQDGRAMPYIYADFDFFETYGIEPLAGRTFSADFATDRMIEPSPENPQTTGAYVLNALAASQLGWTPEEAIGKWFEVGRSRGFQTAVRGPIVGVVPNVYFESLHNAVQPMVYMIPPARISGFATLREASIKITGASVEDTLRYIDAKWAEFVPDQPIQRRFLDEDFTALYLKETRQVQLFIAFSLLAVFIACLGLFGLASFTTERRTREIGVRKVMGSSVWSIVLLLTNDFSKLVLISNLLAWPVAWFAMNRWLENFAYRIDLTPMVFIGSGLIALCIAWMTVGGTAAKAAGAKPVLALRCE